uniref:Uncharacterized protein n=1 Tax=Mustela putorius furo TaxID=9669 RepID=M3Y2Q5_MUSPF
SGPGRTSSAIPREGWSRWGGARCRRRERLAVVSGCSGETFRCVDKSQRQRSSSQTPSREHLCLPCIYD